jgi:DNA-binding HxlR family transcriptional regulator
MVPHRRTKVAPPPPECPLTTCIALIGGAWAPNIIWYLRDDKRRFNELRSDIHGVSAKMLTLRLRQLEEDGIVTREVRPTSPPTVHYGLTELGRRLLPALEAIVEVGHELKRRRQESETAV